MQKLMRMVSQKGMSFGNLGGGMWADLKADPTLTPEFSYLHRAPLWSDERRFSKPVWSWLCGTGKDWTVDPAVVFRTQEGDTHGLDLDNGEKKARLMWGPLGPILKARSHVDLLFLELDTSLTTLPATCVLGSC